MARERKKYYPSEPVVIAYDTVGIFSMSVPLRDAYVKIPVGAKGIILYAEPKMDDNFRTKSKNYWVLITDTLQQVILDTSQFHSP